MFNPNTKYCMVFMTALQLKTALIKKSSNCLAGRFTESDLRKERNTLKSFINAAFIKNITVKLGLESYFNISEKFSSRSRLVRISIRIRFCKCHIFSISEIADR